MQQQIIAIRNAGIEPIVISYDSQKALAPFVTKNSISFAMLSDPESKTIREYGILDERTKKGTKRYGHSYPVTILINYTGKVEAVFAGTTRKRHSPDDLTRAAKK